MVERGKEEAKSHVGKKNGRREQGEERGAHAGGEQTWKSRCGGMTGDGVKCVGGGKGCFAPPPLVPLLQLSLLQW